MAAVPLDEKELPDTNYTAQSHIQSADWSNAILQLDERCMKMYHDLLRPCEEQLQTQAALTLSKDEMTSAHALSTVRLHAPIAYEDFEHRVKTGAIPCDPCNFHACLAGSVLMSGFHYVKAEGADEIVGALVCLKWKSKAKHLITSADCSSGKPLFLSKKGRQYVVENKTRRRQLIKRLREYFKSPQYATLEEEYAQNCGLSLWRRWGLQPDASDEAIEILIFGNCLHDSDDVACNACLSCFPRDDW